jgi:hypothetical protein
VDFRWLRSMRQVRPRQRQDFVGVAFEKADRWMRIDIGTVNPLRRCSARWGK